MRHKIFRNFLPVIMTGLFASATSSVWAQQFNSDNYWTAPHGVATVIATVGQKYSTMLDVVALFPRWEFTFGATQFRADSGVRGSGHYSATAYAKYMFYENRAKNGGGGIMAGTGVQPGFYTAGQVTKDLRTYWTSVPVTFPFHGGDVSLDLMPGATLNKQYGANNDETAWGFTHSTRLAVYKIVPKSAIVGEVFGSEGDAYSKAQYKTGVRYETPSVVAALTYGGGLDGSQGAGLEFGIMVFTPPFLCIGGCEKK